MTNPIINLGLRVTKTFTLRAEDVNIFGDLVHDHNPIHFSADAAKAAGFAKPICHGLLGASLFSGLMASELPGPNTIYLTQNLRFTAPIYVGDEVEVAIEVTQFRKAKGLIATSTTASRIDPETKKRILCIDGYSIGMNKGIQFEGESEWTY